MHQKQFYVGVDWASQSHHVCVLKADGDRHRLLSRWQRYHSTRAQRSLSICATGLIPTLLMSVADRR